MFKKTPNPNLHRLEVNEDGVPVMPEHPARITWRNRIGHISSSRSKECGDRTVWSTTRDGGYILWDQLLSFMGRENWKTIRRNTEED